MAQCWIKAILLLAIAVTFINVFLMSPGVSVLERYDARSFRFEPDGFQHRIERVFLVGLDRCILRRTSVLKSFDVDIHSYTSSAGVTFMCGVGAYDATKPNWTPADIEHELQVGRVRHIETIDPYFLMWGKKMKRSDWGCSVSHWKVYREMHTLNLSMAMVLEDDVTLLPGVSPVSFFNQIEIAVSNLGHLYGRNWDLLYLKWSATGDQKMGKEKIIPEQGLDPGLTKVGCYGTTAAYIISHAGVKKLLALEDDYWSNCMTIDDFLMSLFGRGCPEAWDTAAKLFAKKTLQPPYKYINAYGISRDLLLHGSQEQRHKTRNVDGSREC